MSNGSMLSELRSLAATPGKISDDAATRLTLSAIADVYQKLDEHLSTEQQRTSTMDEMKDDIDGLKRDMKEMKEAITKNLLVSFGSHLSRNPKLAWIYVTVMFVLMNLWFISGFRKLILLAIGINPTLVELLAP